jgi:hypothetical protein
MLTFRCYLLFAFALAIVKVVEVAIGRWVLTPVNRPSEPRPPVPVLCAGRSGARGRTAQTNSGALSAVHTCHLSICTTTPTKAWIASIATTTRRNDGYTPCSDKAGDCS